MVKTRSGKKTERVEPKKVEKKSKWDIGPINRKKYKGSKFRKGVKDVEDLGYATARGVKGVGYAGVNAVEGVGNASVKVVEDVGYAGVSAVESGLTGLEHRLRGLTVNKVEDEMSELQKGISKLGGARRTRTKRRRNKKRARSTKKR